jgi:hypothetical protein
LNPSSLSATLSSLRLHPSSLLSLASSHTSNIFLKNSVKSPASVRIPFPQSVESPEILPVRQFDETTMRLGGRSATDESASRIQACGLTRPVSSLNHINGAKNYASFLL